MYIKVKDFKIFNLFKFKHCVIHDESNAQNDTCPIQINEIIEWEHRKVPTVNLLISSKSNQLGWSALLAGPRSVLPQYIVLCNRITIEKTKI